MSESPIFRALSVAVGAADTAPDGELLRRFAEAADRTAFELVVRRHAELVWGVCRAALPRDPHAAEDAFQATFLILARKAASVRDGSAAGWLFRVARNVAVRARGRAARQDMRPLPDALATASDSAEDEAARREAIPAVAEEVDRLTAKLREAVVLCFFEGHTHAEAAVRLGWPIGTVASRLAKAKDLLRERLTRRGIVLPAGGLAAVLSALQSATAAPAILVRSAVANTVGPANNIPPAVHSLTAGVLSAMRFAKLKMAVALLLVVGVGLTAAFAAVNQNAPADPAPAVAPLVRVPVRAARTADDKDEKAAKELKALQGKWRVVKLEVNGKELPMEEIAKMQFTIKGDEIEQITEGVKDAEKMKIKLSPGASPKEFDLTAVNGPEDVKGKTSPGIYKFTNDTLTICGRRFEQLDKGRPKEFKAVEGVSLVTLERIKDEKEELAALAGEWKAVRGNFFDIEIAADKIADMKWIIAGAEIRMIRDGMAEQKATVRLVPDATPPTFEWTFTTDGGKQEKDAGIYFRQGEKLIICLIEADKEKADKSPELKPAKNATFIVFERVPKK